MLKYLDVDSGYISWKIDLDFPEKILLKSIKGHYILNPYKFSNAYFASGFIIGTPTLLGKNCHITTKGLLLAYESQNEITAAVLYDQLTELLRYIRFESKQVEIQPFSAISSIGWGTAIEKGIRDIPKVLTMGIRSTYYHKMVTINHLTEADRNIFRKKTIPVFEEILLDAYNASIYNEYNKVLLFSAIAVESLLGNTYHRIYERKRRLKKGNADLRIKTFNGTTKDPVWEYLAERTDFKKLLHTAPLYLINRSILLEDESLYRRLIKLYNTRNKIVHWGAPLVHNEDQLLPLNSDGASQSLDIAISVFNWLGIDRYNFIREKGFVKLK
ncbi:MAG: hypothetical protein V4619_16415 [Bacteroidota bacterium]